jgi:protein ImuA
MSDSYTPLARLKRRLEKLERPRRLGGAGLFAFGCEGVDGRLGGGLARGTLHELCASREGDQAAASGEDKGERMHGALYGPGMAELGADPERIILVCAPDTLSALRAGADILGAMGIGAVVIEPFGAAKALDLTASRKLVLTAEKSGAAAFVLRAPEVTMASAAATRWLVSAAASAALSGNAPGHTALSIELARHRGGVVPFQMHLEWNRDQQAFAQPSLSGDLPAALERGQMAA